ncbi:hypothetical protein [Actinoplanes sp. RD1]|uniref:hypothetical protein n=1 Tax=Actinoplanes sp. RD1 TaxID=3064538 RepID=UPI0027428545|nr:hypothetical protein [Actinoplanes sp. RD1]
MTTQTSHHSGGAEYPQFAAGHAQYPPATWQQQAPAAHQYEEQYPPQQYYGGTQDQQQYYGGGQDQQHYYGAQEQQPGHQYHGGQEQQNYGGGQEQQLYGYEPQQAPYPQQPSMYPTAPPWASEPSAPAAHHAPAPATHQPPAPEPPQVPQVGGLLVPYPEEIRTAARAEAPALWPVAVFTFFFGVFGAISAGRRADRARRGGNRSTPYWIAFAVTLAGAWFVWGVIALTVVAPAVNRAVESHKVSVLEHNVISDGQLAKANITATAADCQAAGEENADGTRDYLCQLTLANGEKGQLTITANPDATWTPQQTG